MRTSDQIKSDIRVLREQLAALETELRAAEQAECRVPFEIGQRIKHRGVEFEIGKIEPWGRDNASLKGYKIKKDGTPGRALVWIGSARSFMSGSQ